ncbi:MAG: hypothetical protein ACYS47_00215 [Planctomycetota bacterium]|jgi:hypothetical protein
MDCSEARKAIPLAVGGDEPQDERELRSHLDACTACRGEWETYVRLRETLREAGAGPAPVGDDEFLRGVYRRAWEDPNARTGVANGLRWVLRASAAAAVVVSLVVALVLSNGAPDEREDGIDRSTESAAARVKEDPQPTVALGPVEGPEIFGLADTAPAEEGMDVLLEIDVVPEPKRPQGTEEDDFPLQEVIPVSEVEVCADF